MAKFLTRYIFWAQDKFFKEFQNTLAMELLHTEETELICLTMATDTINGMWFVALGMVADVRVYEYGFEDEYSCFPESWPEFSLQASDRSVCFWDDTDEDDAVEFKLVAIQQRHLFFTVRNKLYIWDWVDCAHLRTIICDGTIHFLHVDASTVVYSGYEEAFYHYEPSTDDEDDDTGCVRFWTVTGTIRDVLNNKDGTRIVNDRLNKQAVDHMDWRIDQQLHMDLIIRTNETMHLAVQQSQMDKVTAFRYDGEQAPAYFAYIGNNGMSFIKRVDPERGTTATRAVSTGRYPSSLAVYNNMLCSIDVADSKAPDAKWSTCFNFYFCNYDAVTLRPIHHQRLQFQNNEFDWLNLAVAQNNLLACGASSAVIRVFKEKHWDKEAVSTFLLCLQRTGFLPELTGDFVIPFLYGVKFDNPDFGGYNDDKEGDCDEWEDDDEWGDDDNEDESD